MNKIVIILLVGLALLMFVLVKRNGDGAQNVDKGTPPADLAEIQLKAEQEQAESFRRTDVAPTI